MRLFGRDLSENLSEARRLPMYLWYFAKIALLFRNPMQFIRAYLAQQSPRSGVLRTRDGMTILLSGHPHDAITVFVVFIREDYGRVPAGTVVLDVGANIGVFALWAVRCGATRVVAVEPSSETFQLLQRNIEANALQQTIFAFQEAVYDRDGERVPFARSGTMYSAIGDGEESESDMVPTVTLDTLIRRAGTRVGLLKLDCEGGEYAALSAVSPASMEKIDAVKMEYHRGEVERLIADFERQALRVTLLAPATPTSGNLWVERA